MTYYSEDKVKYLIDGIEVYMTEEHAEKYQSTHPNADIQAAHAKTIPEEEEDADCTCLPDTPDGRVNGGRGYLCPACNEYFESLREDE